MGANDAIRDRGPGPHRATGTILLVDDDAQVRNLVRAVLQRKGYTVLEAANGPDALEICETYPGPIHLLLTDVEMPGMNGPELVRQATTRRPGCVPVLYMSGGVDEAALRAGGSLGFHFLQKPFTPGELIEKVEAVLQEGKPTED